MCAKEYSAQLHKLKCHTSSPDTELFWGEHKKNISQKIAGNYQVKPMIIITLFFLCNQSLNCKFQFRSFHSIVTGYLLKVLNEF